MSRNTALAGIQSEVEKWGEVAKIGLEIPVAVEGLKAVGGRAKDLVNYVRGEGLEKAKGLKSLVKGGVQEARGAVGTALSRGRETVGALRTQATDAVSAAKTQATDAISGARDIATARTNNLLVSAPSQGETKSAAEAFVKTKVEEPLVQTGRDGVELPQRSKGGLSSYSGETKTQGARNLEYAKSRGFNTRQENLGAERDARLADWKSRMGKAPSESHIEMSTIETKTSAPSASASASVIDDSVPVPKVGSSMSINNTSTSVPLDAAKPSFSGGETKVQSIKGRLPSIPEDGIEIPKVITNSTIEENLSQRLASFKSKVPSSSSLGGVGSKITTVGDDVLEEGTKTLAKSGALQASGDVEEALGTGLLASGIFAPLGALMEGLGAVSEVASVVGGAYGAVQSMVDVSKEDALRNTPLTMPTQAPLDLGGKIATPLVS
jgi:hypothetical protein|tara:strand:+ start:1575 stop:2888 length:1314 start_codon:yes stop_codon:yes gene_type:complete